MARSKASPEGLFNKQHYETLIKARRLANELLPVMDKAESCGVDCSTWRAQLAQADADLANIQTHFMTPAPSY